MRIYLTDIQKRLLFILAIEPCSRGQLEELTAIARTTIYDNLKKLEKFNVLERYKVYNGGTKGRPTIYWRFKKHAK